MNRAITTALVTGATGFIGGALARRLAQSGTRTICPVRASSARASTLDDVAGIELLRLPSFSDAELARVLRAAPTPVVFHLASYGVKPTERDPEAMIDGTVTLTARLVAALAGASPKRFIYVGSCSEYAPAHANERINESHSLAPLSLYGAAKASAGLVGDALARQLGVPFVTLRPFGVYGVGEGPHRLVPHLIDHLTRGEVPALTPGEQVRDLTYIDDLLDALVLAATSPAITLHAAYNVCSGLPVTIAAVSKAVARLLGKPSADLGLGRRRYRDDESMWVVGDNRRFHEATGWKPAVDLDGGIQRMIAAAHRGGAS